MESTQSQKNSCICWQAGCSGEKCLEESIRKHKFICSIRTMLAKKKFEKKFIGRERIKDSE